jgi:putative transposase
MILAKPEFAEIIIESIIWLKEHNWAQICGFVIMPNHYHSILGLCSEKSLSQVMESLGKFTARQINKIIGREYKFWEEGFHDHGIRNRKDFDDILKYVHENPVRAGLVTLPELWPYSTANPKHAHLINWDWIGMSV